MGELLLPVSSWLFRVPVFAMSFCPSVFFVVCKKGSCLLRRYEKGKQFPPKMGDIGIREPGGSGSALKLAMDHLGSCIGQ